MSKTRLCVLTGCQMEGLVSALQIMFPAYDVEGFHTYRLLGDDRSELQERLRAADIVFALPLEAKFGDLSFDRIHRLGPKVQLVPHVVFAAFHPDITYLERSDETRVQTPMTDYNSTIAIAAYLLGLDVERTLRLYNAYTYQAVGHFDLVENSARSLLADFIVRGIDLKAALDRWLRHPDPFMYSMNHPRSFVLADVALAAARAAGLAVETSPPGLDRMPDRLAEWVVYPVYTEIAARLGKIGDYRFKGLPAEGPTPFSLRDFVTGSFASYDREDISQWEISKRIASTKEVLGNLVSRGSSASDKRSTSPAKGRTAPYAEPRNVTSTMDCFFYHTTDLPAGTQYGPWDLRGRFDDYIGNIDLKGQRVLDVGTATGFLSFCAEEAGAAEVVSFDLDSADRQHLLPFADSDYVRDHAKWSVAQTAAFQRWKNAYWLTHRLKNSKAKVVYGDVYALPEAIGQFDVIILGAILEHLADPIRALASIAKHSSKYIIINTDCIDSEQPIAHFNGRPEYPENSYIFWTYSIGTYRQIMGILGYDIEIIKRNIFLARRPSGEPTEADRTTIICRKKKTGQQAAGLKTAA